MPDSFTLNGARAIGGPEFFEALFDHALDAVLISDDSSTYVEVNSAGCELIGLPRDQILGRQVQDFFEMGKAETVAHAWGSFLEKGVSQGECMVRRPNGEVRWCSFKAKANFCPGLHMSVVRDITEWRGSIDALSESNRRLSFLSDVNRDLLINERPRTILNKLLADLSSELGLEVYFHYLVTGTRLHLDCSAGVPEDAARCYEWLEFGEAVCGTVACQRQIRVFEDVQASRDPMTEVIRSLGMQAYVCSPLLLGSELIGTLSFGTRRRPRFAPGEVQFLETVVNAITIALQRENLIADLENNNGELQRKNQELERSNGELYHFAYAVGHDLKAPLRTVSSFAQLLASRMKDQGGEAQEFVAFIENAVKGMNKFLEDLLTYAQAGPRTQPELKATDLNLALEWALMNMSSAVLETGAQIKHDPLPEIRADQAQMVQLFQNLIGNALKYRSERPPEVNISARRAENYFVVSVSDNGIGIAPQYHQSIFGIFKRLHGADVAGSGLGLALCKRVVENHGGRIWVESAPQQGATFYFSIPA